MQRLFKVLAMASMGFATLGRAVVPVGVFAVLVVGMHAGTDRVDDHAFAILNTIDIVVDSAVAVILETVLGWTTASAERIARITFSIQDFVDLDAKYSLSRIVALVFEIASDLALALPLILHRTRTFSLQTYWIRLSSDLTVLRVVGPLAVFFAGTAGIFLVAREIQVGVHGWLVQYDALMKVADPAARTVAGLAALLVAWRLGWVALRRSFTMAEARAQRDDRMMTPRSKRRFRGLFVAIVVLPISVLALFEATPPWSVVRDFFGG